ncbi:hypothetical protein M514_01176, partial [Trichuris suis]
MSRLNNRCLDGSCTESPVAGDESNLAENRQRAVQMSEPVGTNACTAQRASQSIDGRLKVDTPLAKLHDAKTLNRAHSTVGRHGQIASITKAPNSEPYRREKRKAIATSTGLLHTSVHQNTQQGSLCRNVKLVDEVENLFFGDY